MSARPDELAPHVALALGCVHREYPNQIAHRLGSDDDLAPPRALHPAFYGCYDWHSAVHGHWLLARALRCAPEATFAPEAAAALTTSLTAANLAAEHAYVKARPGFERPYGLAWLLTLHLELVELGSPHAATLRPLAELGRDHLAAWLPKLSHPIRVGTHAQTAFGMGLALDWARGVGDDRFEALLVERARAFHGADRDLAVHLEPSGEDFLSPALGVADLMRRALPPRELGVWLARALPDLSSLSPVAVTDPDDGRLAHLDGLNLSRAFMLEGMAHALPATDTRRDAMRGVAAVHRDHGLRGASFHTYAGAHWLGTFATYLLTRRGIPTP